jgi:hypothetical protein
MISCRPTLFAGWSCALILAALAASTAVAQSVPAELSVLVAKAKLDRPVTAWCRGEFQSGRPEAFAMAVTAEAGGGRYVVLDTEGTVVELATFARHPDLSCYSRAQAQRLNASIARSQTIQGGVTPRWNTAVVCGFVDDTTSVCWQHSPVDGMFVKVGGWVT